MHCDPQMSLQEIAPPFKSSRGAIIHRCCTDHFIRAELPDKTLRIHLRNRARQTGICDAKRRAIKAISILAIGAVAVITAGCATNPPSGTISQSPAAQRDYQLLSVTWQLMRGVDNGKPVTASQARITILITDRNTFRFPKGQSGGNVLSRALRGESRHSIQTSRLNRTRRTERRSGRAAEYTRFPILLTSVRASARPVARGRRSSSRLGAVGGFFSIGSKSDLCLRSRHSNSR
jgi:hypothetical protein